MHDADVTRDESRMKARRVVVQVRHCPAMSTRDPKPELDPRFGDPDASPTPWAEARDLLDGAMAYWISTVRRDGRPHVTTIAGVWIDDAFHFTTGQGEQKAVNLRTNTNVVITAGSSAFEGLDVVIEGEAVRVRDVGRLRRIAHAYQAKYPDVFNFVERDGAMHIPEVEDEVLVFEVRATRGFGFGKSPFSQTRWRF